MRHRQQLRYRQMVVALGVAGLCLTAGVASQLNRLEPPRSMRHVVQPGETLWSVADLTHCDSFDRRELVWLLKQVNDLDRPALRPGQVLYVPVGAPSVRQARRDPQAFRELVGAPQDPLAL